MTTAKKTKRVARVTQAMIARDVIKWIKAGRLQAESMTYCLLPKQLRGRSGDLKSLLEKAKPTADWSSKCRVCALGALFISDVLKRDRFNIGVQDTSVDHRTMKSHLASIFPEQDLLLIEAAFEGFTVDPKSPLFSLASYVLHYEKALPNEEHRLIVIMQNIIKNGSFRPDLESWNTPYHQE